MRSAVLADTGPLFAAVDPDDQHHARARAEMRRLAQEQRTVLLPYPILLEAYTLVLYRLGKPVADRWLDEVETGAMLINPLPEDYAAARRRAGAYPDQRITLFDGVLAALAARLGCEVWTYDHHFDIMRTSVWRV